MSATPALGLGDVAFLEVTSLGPRGAFFGGPGVAGDLLVPTAQLTLDVAYRERHAVGVVEADGGLGGLGGTMRVAEMLTDGGGFAVDTWVQGEAWRRHAGMGVFVIVERRFVGLLPASEPHALTRGEAARFRVARVHDDGKVVLSLRGLAADEAAADAVKLLAFLARPGSPPLGDRTDGERVHALVGISKKALKRAAGRLLKEQKIEIDRDGSYAIKR